MDEVACTGAAIVITKNGRPVAQLVPPPGHVSGRRPAFGMHRGMVGPIGDVDLDAPVAEPGAWTADEDNVLQQR